METADFYFDYLSPYAYLASLRVESVCAPQGVHVRPHPVLFAGLLNHWGQRGPAEIAPKAAHALRECLRHAALYHVPLRAPKFHPFPSLVPLRMTWAAPPEARSQVMHLLFDHGWGQGGDLGDADELARVLDTAGLPGSHWKEIATTEPIKRALREATDQAVARGVFGVPTLHLRDEIFWGLDQLGTVERILEGRDPLAGIDLESIGAHGRSAWRKEVPLDAGAIPVTYHTCAPPFAQELTQSLESLLVICFPDAQSEYLARRMKRHPSVQLCTATCGERMIGFKLGYARSDDEFYSWLGGVHPDLRSRGVASELMQHQHAWCSKAGYRYVTTETLSDNAAMLRLDLKHGFQVTGTRLDDRGLKVLLTKELSSASVGYVG